MRCSSSVEPRVVGAIPIFAEQLKRGAAVARGTVNAQVEGSNPSASAIFYWVVRIAAIPNDCKSFLFGVQWFESTTAHHFCLHSVMVSTVPFHGISKGSNPFGDANLK